MALRASTGSARLAVESLEERILEIEVEKAAGSLRLRGRRGSAAEDGVGEVELSSDSDEAEDETIEGSVTAGGEGGDEDFASESLRSTGAKSSLAEEELE